jgi:hypothetical protein
VARRYLFREFRSREERREYLRDRDARYNWVFPRIDRTRDDFVDLTDFAGVLFPHSVVRQSAFKAIVEALAKKRKPLCLRDIVFAVEEKVKVSNTTIGDVWKCMLRSGLLSKKFRQDPAQLSTIFVFRLRDLAKYWESLVTMHMPQRKSLHMDKAGITHD